MSAMTAIAAAVPLMQTCCLQHSINAARTLAAEPLGRAQVRRGRAVPRGRAAGPLGRGAACLGSLRVLLGVGRSPEAVLARPRELQEANLSAVEHASLLAR